MPFQEASIAPAFAGRVSALGTENAFKIAPRIREVEQSGQHVIKCNIGEPDFALPLHIAEEVKRQIDLDQTHYVDPQGIEPLRKAIARRTGERRGLQITPDRVVVFPGAKPAIGFAQQVYCNPGDEVIYPSPGFPIYESFITLLSRALTNLLENARQAMPSGGSITVTAAPEDTAWVRITISDTGVGMDDTARARAFEPYFSTKTAGSGLGLPNAKRNVELCGGTMTLESAPGRGTAITIRLRRAEAPGPDGSSHG